MKWAVLEGEKGLLKKLAHLSAATQRRIMRPAISQTLTPINRQAKANAPVGTGLLKKALGRKVVASKRTGEIVGMVGVRRGFKTLGPYGKPMDPSNYAHLVEFGHGGPAPAPAHPFLRPALDTRRAEALAIVARVAGERLKKEASR